MSARIDRVEVTPTAFADPPLLNAAGTHEPLALRTVVELRTSAGTVGLGETHGGARLLDDIRAAAAVVVGLDVSEVAEAMRRVEAELGQPRADRALAPVEVAMLDAHGQDLGAPVADLLGGAARDRVEFGGYLFYKWDRHLGATEPDAWGEVADGAGLVRLARRLHAEHGFTSWKVKGGVRSIAAEVADVRVLAEAFGDHAVRLDPNARWDAQASLAAAQQVDGVLEYLEDPCEGMAQMGWLRERSPVPLATNMLNESYAGHLDLIRERAADVVLLDHHIVGGLSRAKELADRCQAVGMATSMHSNSHLGISLAAMTHLAAAVTGDVRTNDTHYPWNRGSEVVAGGPLPIVGGQVAVPAGPGLGVRLDADRLAEAHERYRGSDIRERDDATYARRRVPTFERNRGRWTFEDHPGAVAG